MGGIFVQTLFVCKNNSNWVLCHIMVIDKIAWLWWLYQPFCNHSVFENYFQVVVNIFKGHLQWLERTLLANGLCCIMCQKLWRLVSISASRGVEVSYTASWLELWWHNWPAWLRALSIQWIEKISEHDTPTPWLTLLLVLVVLSKIRVNQVS